MNNSNTHNPVTDPPTEPTGFIYRTYSAAKREDCEEKPINEGPNQAEAQVSFAVGGSLSQVSFEDGKTKGRTASNLGGGIKRKVRGFSRVSRRNFLRKLASINRTAFRAYKGRVFSVTLTYPHEYPEDPEVCKRHLKALYKRLKRKLGDFAGFWRMGIQKRGAWHFHLLLFMPPSPRLLARLRSFIGPAWYEVCGEVSEGHLLVGTRVEEVRTWRRATSYAEKYVAKEEQEFPEGLETGRIWGAWNAEFLPVRWETTKVTLKDAYRIRRWFRRLAKMRGRGSLHRLTVFVRYENVVRLLKFMGYCQEE